MAQPQNGALDVGGASERVTSHAKPNVPQFRCATIIATRCCEVLAEQPRIRQLYRVRDSCLWGRSLVALIPLAVG